MARVEAEPKPYMPRVLCERASLFAACHICLSHKVGSETLRGCQIDHNRNPRTTANRAAVRRTTKRRPTPPRPWDVIWCAIKGRALLPLTALMFCVALVLVIPRDAFVDGRLYCSLQYYQFAKDPKHLVDRVCVWLKEPPVAITTTPPKLVTSQQRRETAPIDDARDLTDVPPEYQE